MPVDRYEPGSRSRSKQDASPGEVARAALIPPEERSDLDARVKALLARNAALRLVEAARDLPRPMEAES